MGIGYYIHLLLDAIIDCIFVIFSGRKHEVLAPLSNPIVGMGAKKLAHRIRTRQLSSEEVVIAFIKRIKKINSIINAVVDERFDEAILEARKCDRLLMSQADPEELVQSHPFLGVPFTTKESTQCRGMKCSFGLMPRKHCIAEEDAQVIKYMKEAGGILIAVTNVPQLNLWFETHNPVYGITKNPYDTTRIAGGSSGGEASLIASCGSPFGVGTDIGGSIRIPAFMCGVFGHKCSSRLTRTKGLTYRDGSSDETTMLVVGPIARHAEDLVFGLEIMLGPESKMLNLDIPVDFKSLKYYFMAENGDPLCSNLSGEMRNIMKMVVDYFGRFADVTEIKLENMQYSSKLFKYWVLKEDYSNFKYDVTGRQYNAGAWIELLKFLLRRSDLSFSAIMMLFNTQVLPAVNPKWAERITEQLRDSLLSILDDDGVLFFTSWPTTAHKHHVGYFRPYNFSYMSIFNALKVPVTQVPLGLSQNGLPIGIQVVAAPYNDRLCLAVAAELESIFGGYVSPFPFTK